MAKIEYFQNPKTKWFFKMVGCIPVNRSIHDANAKDLAIEVLENNYALGLFPEGTRNKTFPEPLLLPFHPGTFTLAKEAHCPIVVAAIQNTSAVSRRWPLHRTHIYLDVVGVVDTEIVEQKNVQELAETTRSMILKRFEEKEARFYHLDPKKSKDNKAVSK